MTALAALLPPFRVLRTLAELEEGELEVILRIETPDSPGRLPRVTGPAATAAQPVAEFSIKKFE